MSEPIPAPEPDGESARMDQVDRVQWGPTEPDEIAVLDKYLDYDTHTGTYSGRVGD